MKTINIYETPYNDIFVESVADGDQHTYCCSTFDNYDHFKTTLPKTESNMVRLTTDEWEPDESVPNGIYKPVRRLIGTYTIY